MRIIHPPAPQRPGTVPAGVVTIVGASRWSGMLTAAGIVSAIVAVYRDKGAYLALPFLVVYSLMSLTESIAVTYNDFRWVIFTAIAVKLAWPDSKAID